MRRPRWIPVWLVALVVAFAIPAHAFCGFYVATGDGPLFSDASRVVLMRQGMRTVMSIQNDYQGPLENFALVVPVPVVLERANVRTLPNGVMDRVDRLTSPRLVEYWEEDPCQHTADDDKEGGTGVRAKGEEGSLGNPNLKPRVKVEAEFSVDEYDIVVLSAEDSGALDTWLRTNGYVIPQGAEPYLRPYVEEGSKFFVAKVDPRRVHFRFGRAALSPLRFFYDAPTFSLPTRLGLINSSGTQDLIVYILASERYETANYENLTIPTNLVVKDETRQRFNEFYSSLYDRTVQGHPHAVVTEYAWSPQNCDPCPAGAGPLSDDDMMLLGRDVARLTTDGVLTLTRLHARYGKSSAGEDLVFKVAPAIVGGRGTPDVDGLLPTKLEPSDTSAFQARYVIRHAWSGPVSCSKPAFGMWGPPPYRLSSPPRPNANGRRDLDVSAMIVDGKEAHAALTPGNRVRAFFEGFVDSTERKARFDVFALLAALVVVPFIGWRNRRGFFATGGIQALLSVVALGSGAIVWDGNIRAMAFDVVPVLATILGAGVIAAFRVPPVMRADGLRFALVLAALLPLLASFWVAWSGARVAAGAIATEVMEFGLAARVTSESLSESLAAIVLGSLRSAVLLFAVCLFARPSREGQPKPFAPALLAAAGIFAFAVASRFLIWAHLGRVDGAILASLVFAMYVVHDAFARRGGRRAGLVVVTALLAVALMSLVGFQYGLSEALGRLAGESIEQEQRVLVARFSVQGAQLRTIVLLIDTFLLVTFTVVRARTATTRLNGWNVASVFAVMLTLAAVVLAPVWTGQLPAVRALDAELARFVVPPSGSLPSAKKPTPELDGPAFVVDRERVLYATPSPRALPAPFTAQLNADLARSAADTSLAPLLVAPPDLTLRGLLQALAPVLESKQTEYRLLPATQTDPLAGVWAPLLLIDAVHPHDVGLEPVFTLNERSGSGAHRCTGFAFDGMTLSLVPLLCDGDAYVLADYELEGTILPRIGSPTSIFDSIQAADAASLAVVLVDPEITIEKVDVALGSVAGFTNPPYGRDNPPLFPRIVLTPGLPTLRNTHKE